MKYNGTYIQEEETYTLWVDYSYYWDNGDYYQPPEADLEVQRVMLNNIDITDFYWDYVDDSMHSQIKEYAEENRPN